MRNKLLFFLCPSLLLTTLFTYPKVNTVTQASTLEVDYKNKAYQVCDVQDKVDNYFLSDSMYTPVTFRTQLKNSLRIKKPKSGYLTIWLTFSESVQSIEEEGDMQLSLLNDDGTVFLSKSLSDERWDDAAYEFYWLLRNNELFIQIDCSKASNYITLCGEEYVSSNNNFLITLGNEDNENYIKKFMMYDGTIDVNKTYSPSVLGKYPYTNEILYDGDKYYINIDYDNRLTINDILKNVTAYDYSDNKEINKTIKNDNYSTALANNQLGTYTFDISATDGSKNTSAITISANIIDKTAPDIIGNETLEVSYTELNNLLQLDISKYYYGLDNHDGRVAIDNKTITLSTKFADYLIYVNATDSSSNVGRKPVHLKVIDDVAPTVEGPTQINLYQYQLGSTSSLLSYFDFSDGLGSGIKEKGIRPSSLDNNWGKSGEYPIVVYCIDNFDNLTEYNVNVSIKDGIGPVFFINANTLELTTSTLSTSMDVVNTLMERGNISHKNYISSSFLDSNYIDNYNKEGSYDTKLVCFDEDGNRDFFNITIKVSSPQPKNVFEKIAHSINNFFNKAGLFFKYIFNKLIRKI